MRASKTSSGIRSVHLKNWKRGRTVFRELRARGLSVEAASAGAGDSRRWLRNSGMPIHIAFPHRCFDELDIPRLAEAK